VAGVAAHAERPVWEDQLMLSDHPVFPILLSTDLDASPTFYRDTLGLEILREDPDRIVFRCGGGTQLVITDSSSGPRARRHRWHGVSRT
jgi:hypothetical protein